MRVLREGFKNSVTEKSVKVDKEVEVEFYVGHSALGRKYKVEVWGLKGPLHLQ